MSDCIFCKIIKGEIPCFKIYEDDKTLAFLDIADDYVGHTLVIPKNHCTNILDASAEDVTAVFNTVQKIAKHYTQKCGFDGVNLINASGISAQQTVFHLHIHIIPRKTGDGVNVFPQTKKQNTNLEELAKILALD